jgi:hypothetical protein
MLWLSNHTEIHDLELGRKIGSLSAGAKVSFSGSIPIIEDLSVTAAIDPDSGLPRVLMRMPPSKFRNTDMLEDDLARDTAWDWPKDMPVNETIGTGRVSVGRAVHGDHLFFLKCTHSLDFHALSVGDRPSLDKLSLLCFRPGHREALEIPLIFQADVLAKFLVGESAGVSTPLQPEFDVPNLKATPAGLFFHFSDKWPHEKGFGSSKPGLLHIAWRDVNDWLARHGHAPIRSEAASGVAVPSR